MNALSPDAARQRPLTSLRKDRRLNRRVPVSIRGRFLADDNEDHRLLTLNMSCGGARLRANRRPPVGTPLVCYFDDLGRIEAEVVRHTEDGFAVRFRVTQRKRDKIADRLTWLANYKQLGLSDERAEPRHAAGGPAMVTRADGRVLQCRTIDISLSGAAFECNGPAPLVGERVTVGHLVGEVVRTLRHGFAIRYIHGEKPD